MTPESTVPATKAASASPFAGVRRLSRALAIALALATAPAVAHAQTADVVVSSDVYVDTDPSALTDFREPLSPYGVWVDDSTYGTVWVPNAVVVGPDFAPYQTAGHWTLTDEGDWLWVSDYEWGYLPFHYGRWVWISGRGWAWIPGRTYAPAWVTWRVSDYGYIGWAPMPPTWYWYGGSAVSLWVVPPAAFVFCASSHVFHHHVSTVVVHDTHVIRQIGAHSRTYTPAHPTTGGTVHTGAAPGNPGGTSAIAPNQRAGWYPKGPSLAEAKIPDGVAPQARSGHDARALAFSTPSSTTRLKTAPQAGPALRSGLQVRDDSGAASTSGRSRVSVSGSPGLTIQRDREPVVRTPTPQPRFDSAPMSAAPSRPAPRSDAGGGVVHRAAPSQPAPVASPPVTKHSSSSAQPPARSTPSVSAPPARSTPSVSAPSHVRVQPSSPSGGSRSAPSRPAPSGGRSSHRR